jgi:hypothetical protein
MVLTAAFLGAFVAFLFALAGQYYLLERQEKFQREMLKSQQEFQDRLQKEQQAWQHTLLCADIKARVDAAEYQRQVDQKRDMDRRNFERELLAFKGLH